MEFLELQDRPILICGLANRKSVAYHAGTVLAEAGAKVAYAVRSEERRQQVSKFVGDAPVFVCDVSDQSQIDRLAEDVAARFGKIHGFVHSLAFADYSAGWLPFHETPRAAFLQALDISCYSMLSLARALRPVIDPEQGSVVAVSISTTRMAAENYGYMAPIKAALDSSICFLAKSFSQFSQVRFNAVAPGLLKSSASAGIPGYVESYLYAERATLRKRAVETREVGNAIAFLLSPRSSGINAQNMVIDAGMGINYFDNELVHGRPEQA